MPVEIWVALIGFVGVCVTVMGSIWIWRKTTQQTEKAAHQTETVEADKTGILGLQELARQHAADYEAWRAERAEMIRERAEDRGRLDRLEAEMHTLRLERAAADAKIEHLQGERISLIGYIKKLIDFIKGNGHVPPPPDQPILADTVTI